MPPLLSGRFRPLLTTTALYMAVSLLLRIVLSARFGFAAGMGVMEFAGSLFLGSVNDLVELSYLLIPLTIFLLVAPQRLLNSRTYRLLTHGAAFSILFGFIYLATVEYFFFEEFNARFNLVAVDYLIYPHEVFINIWESYHVGWILLAIGVIALLLYRLLDRWLVRRQPPPPLPVAGRLRILLAQTVVVVLLVITASTDSLAVFPNRVANEITANGLSSLFRALHTNELDYDRYYRTIDNGRALKLLRTGLAQGGGQFRSKDAADLNRSFPAKSGGLGKLNVVVIVEESFGAQFVGAYGDRRGLTPAFDQLAKDSILFTNAYATGTRTVRGLEAITTSLPPIPSEGIIKRPGSEHIANWGAVMRRQGYRTSFLYGGYGLFDNMNHFFGNNGFAVSDRRDIDNPRFANIWGVCDQDLFDHALDYYDREGATGMPFFSLIMTTSNHQPFTFPAGVEGVPPAGGGRLAGVRYADFALGRFMDHARQHNWYGHTLFVVVADHDARVYGREQIPLEHYRIPLLVFAPGRLADARLTIPTSQIDIAPTVLGLLGLPYTAPFYGQDVLSAGADKNRPILVNHDHDVGLLVGDRLVVLGLHQEASTYRYDAGRELLQPLPPDPALTDMATAYYQTAFNLFAGHRYQ